MRGVRKDRLNVRITTAAVERHAGDCTDMAVHMDSLGV